MNFFFNGGRGLNVPRLNCFWFESWISATMHIHLSADSYQGDHKHAKGALELISSCYSKVGHRPKQ